jgi:hypothetical protein
MRKRQWYILDDGNNPVPVPSTDDFLEWEDRTGKDKQRVAITHAPSWSASTVFCGNDTQLDEHGPSELVATLDKAKLPQMMEDGWKPGTKYVECVMGHNEFDEASKVLAELLTKTDDELGDGRFKLIDEWGGLTLDVVTLK